MKAILCNNCGSQVSKDNPVGHLVIKATWEGQETKYCRPNEPIQTGQQSGHKGVPIQGHQVGQRIQPEDDPYLWRDDIYWVKDRS